MVWIDLTVKMLAVSTQLDLTVKMLAVSTQFRLHGLVIEVLAPGARGQVLQVKVGTQEAVLSQHHHTERHPC